ncbi:MAG: DNRLRE domain-containing protein [Terriglobales bacterium]
MKRLTAQTGLVSLLGLLLFLWTAAHGQITPAGDSYTNTATPTTNFGAATLLDVNGAKQITYIQFNLASIPATASVSQATLKLYVNAVTTAGSFNVDYVNGTWSESKIDASNAPPLGAAIASNVNVTTADKNQYILVNVTSAVQAWLSGSETNNGLALVANSTFDATFDSKESTTTSHSAELDIAYAGGDGTITGVTTASGSGLTGGGTSGTLSLSLTNGCAANQVLQWNGSTWACSSAGAGTITGVTAGTALTGGGTSGNVTLNLNTSQVPLLAGSNVFTANNLFESTVNFNGLASFANAAFLASTFTGNALFQPSADTDAIDAYTSGSGKTALVGIEYAVSGGSYGAYAITHDGTGAGVAGINEANNTGAGVIGKGEGVGVYGLGTSGASAGGVEGQGFSATTGSGLGGTAGVVGYGGEEDPDVASDEGGPGGIFVGSAIGGDGIEAYASLGLGGYFFGGVEIDGNLSKSGGSFKIDDPIDPANKYLYHSFVESPDMKNVYDGVATLDADGEAVIQMPDWFGVLNRDFRYQLTSIGGFAPVYIAEKLANNRFTIGGGKPGLEVSWQITGIRQDAWANAHRIPLEVDKEAKLKGFYIHPELYGAPPEKQIQWARHPQQMKSMQEHGQQMKGNQAQPTQSAALPHGVTK